MSESVDQFSEVNNNLERNNERPQSWYFSPIRRRHWIKCETCDVYVTSEKLLQTHINGKKHKMICKKKEENVSIYSCHICKLLTNGKLQYEEHISGKVHKTRIEEQRSLDDFKFYFLYTSVVVILFFIFIYYIFYYMFSNMY